MSSDGITMQEFADWYPEQFRSWLEHLTPGATLFAPDAYVSLRDHDGHEGWFVQELRRGGTLFALSTQYADYGGGCGADLCIFPTCWASPKTGKWFSSEAGDDDAAWAALILELF